MRIRASRSVSRDKTERRVDAVIDDGDIKTIAFADRKPIVNPGTTERIDAHADIGTANRIHVEYIAEIDHVRVEIVVAAARSTFSMGILCMPCRPFLRHALAFVSIQPVTLVPAGPPFGGLYLMPPSSGGLGEGAMTMPSANPVTRPQL